MWICYICGWFPITVQVVCSTPHQPASRWSAQIRLYLPTASWLVHMPGVTAQHFDSLMDGSPGVKLKALVTGEMSLGPCQGHSMSQQYCKTQSECPPNLTNILFHANGSMVITSKKVSTKMNEQLCQAGKLSAGPLLNNV